MGLALDDLPRQELIDALLRCCHAPAWAHRVADRAPFTDRATVLAVAEQELARSDDADVDAALSAHPRIGERPTGADSQREQKAVLGADAQVLEALAAGNREYEERFGHVYLVCASGRSAEELLEVLRSRLGNDPGTERTVLRRELAAITRLRLSLLLDQTAPAGAAS